GAAVPPGGPPPGAPGPPSGPAAPTVFGRAAAPTAEPTTLACDAGALAEGRIESAQDRVGAAVVLVSCGAPVGQEVRIVDAEGAALPQGRVGEIELRGPNIGRGYWKRADRALRDPGGWLRTGDYGALLDGRLLVTGRLKDVIIVDGRNHYPQDIEETVQSAVDLVRRDRLAAFGVTRADDTGEELVVVAEHRREIDPTEEETRARERDVRAAVSARHGVRLGALLLVPPGSVPRTSSGKVARAACRARFLDGGFDPW
ncbi:AMP-binding protein, partial [Streptomyces sp. NPDC127044]